MKSKVSTFNRRLSSESSFDSENDDATYSDANDLRFEVRTPVHYTLHTLSTTYYIVCVL